MSFSSIRQALLDLPDAAPEPMVCSVFISEPYFYPKVNHHIFEIPSYAHIAGAAFTRVPAA